MVHDGFYDLGHEERIVTVEESESDDELLGDEAEISSC